MKKPQRQQNEVESSPAAGTSNRNEPQYTSITRNRPAKPQGVQKPDDSTGNQDEDRLTNYVTIERNRSRTTEGIPLEVSTEGGPQYVTLQRSNNRKTTQSPDISNSDDSRNVIFLDSNILRGRQSTSAPTTPATTTTTTTTPRPVRILIPQSVLNPKPESVVSRLNLDPRRPQTPSPSRRTTTTQATDIEEYYLDEFYYDDLNEENNGKKASDPDTANTLIEVDDTSALQSSPKPVDNELGSSNSRGPGRATTEVIPSTRSATTAASTTIDTTTKNPASTIDIFANFEALSTESSKPKDSIAFSRPEIESR